jgi:hypothetical protein
MNHLIACSNCARHVRASEPSCPFCGAARDPAASQVPVLPRGRLSRAATLAFGALVGASALTASCGGDSDNDDEGSGTGEAGEGGDAATPSASGGTGNMPSASGGAVAVPVYGAPFPTGGTVGTGGSPTSGGTNSSGGMNQNPPATGGRRSTGGEGGSGGKDEPGGAGGEVAVGGFVAVYGAPPEPQGGKPAAGTGGGPGNVPVPVYGASPPLPDGERKP